MSNKREKEKVQSKNETKTMGFVQLPTLVMYDRRLNSTQKILWSILERYRGNNANCFPGIARIAKGLGLGKRAVYNHLEKLEELGLIDRERRPGHSNVYNIADMEDVYCNGKKQLLDDVVEMLRVAGEETTAETVLKMREDNTKREKSKPKAKQKPEPKPKVKLQKPVRKLEDAMAKAGEQLEKSEAASSRRKERRLKLAQDPSYQKAKIRKDTDDTVLTVNDVEEEWRVAAKEKWPEAPSVCSKWGMKDRGIAKRMCDRYGHESVIQVLVTVIQNWEDYVDRFDLNGYPNVKLVAGFADSWFPEIESGHSIDPRSKRERVRNEREYDESATTDGGGISFL